MKFFIAVFSLVAVTMAQRPFYAGLRPIGYPELADRFVTPDDTESTTASLVNRFGEDGQPITTTTVRLPVDALGDKNLIDRISKWPVDKQPFWYINWKQIEEHRQTRPNNAQGSAVAPQRPVASQGSAVSQGSGSPQGSVASQNVVPPQRPSNQRRPVIQQTPNDQFRNQQQQRPQPTNFD